MLRIRNRFRFGQEWLVKRSSLQTGCICRESFSTSSVIPNSPSKGTNLTDTNVSSRTTASSTVLGSVFSKDKKIGLAGSNLRDSLRRVEVGLVKPLSGSRAVSDPPTPHPKPSATPKAHNQASDKPPHSRSSDATTSPRSSTTARAVSQDILNAINDRPVSSSQVVSSSNTLEEGDLITDGEQRFIKQQQKISMKRQKLAEEYGPGIGSTRFNPFQETFKSSHHHQRKHKDDKKHNSNHSSSPSNSQGPGHHQGTPQFPRLTAEALQTRQDPAFFDAKYRLRQRRESIDRYLEMHEMQTVSSASGAEAQGSDNPVRKLVVPVEGLTSRQIAQRMSAKLVDIRDKLTEMGEWPAGAGSMAEDTLLDPDVVELLALDLDFAVQRVIASEDEAAGLYDDAIRAQISFRQRQAAQNAKLEASGKALHQRPPTVCIVGHVDHGKTTLLDSLRTSAAAAAAAASSAASSTTKKSSKTKKESSSSSSSSSSSPPGGAADRKSRTLADGEAGGITQRLSAFTVQDARSGQSVVFLDTPGHAAFASMRHKGAAATDIAVLVVALDEGVMPQTEDAVRAVKDAGCAVIVALNKIDKLSASQRPAARAKVLSSLAQFDLLAEELGGEVQVVEVAGKTGEGVTELLSAIAVQSDVLDLKCAPDAPAEAVVLDAKLEKGRGIVADVIVRSGSLRNGDCVVVGSVSGRVKAIYNDENVAIPVAAPSQPVRLLGLKELPVSGTELLVVENEARAKQIADRRLKIASLRAQQQQQQLSMRHVIAASATGDAAKDTAPSSSTDASAGPRTPRLSMAVVLKADSLGALEALRQLVEEIARASGDTLLHLHVASSGVGSVTQSDIDILGSSHKTSSSSSSSSSAVDQSNGVTETMILAFNVSVADNTTKLKAKQLDVDIVRDDVIYRLEDALKHRIEDLLPQERVETKEGAARVLKVFQLKDSKNTVVAGSSIVLGRVATLPYLIKEENKKLGHSNNAGASSAAKVNGFYRVIRDGVVIHEHPMHRIELKRFKDAAGEVRAGLECGMSFDGYSDVLEGDDIECYKVTLQRRNLMLSPAFQYRPSTATSTSNASSSSSSSSSSLEKDKKK